MNDFLIVQRAKLGDPSNFNRHPMICSPMTNMVQINSLKDTSGNVKNFAPEISFSNFTEMFQIVTILICHFRDLYCPLYCDPLTQS